MGVLAWLAVVYALRHPIRLEINAIVAGPPPGSRERLTPGVAAPRGGTHSRAMQPPPSGLDDPEQAAFAWARFRTIMAWMTLAAAIAVAGAMIALAEIYGPLNGVTMLGVIGGIGGTVMLTGALMGLVFLSSGTGHDEDVDRRP
ncbi:hypothetical protein LTR94_033699 [Friedmanniomyces endolithicus]|nr:hypothetical protein LTR94_033699 [Friedmanniomyces endolithicus]